FGKKPWRPEDDQVLGTRPDDKIALLLGRTVNAVKARRHVLGILSVTHRQRGPARPPKQWTAEEAKLLGTMPDAQAAKKLGLGTWTVGDRRRELGVAPAPRSTYAAQANAWTPQ